MALPLIHGDAPLHYGCGVHHQLSASPKILKAKEIHQPWNYYPADPHS